MNQLNHEAAISAAAMMSGFVEDRGVPGAVEAVREAMEHAYGCVEIYAAIAGCAVLSATLCNEAKGALPWLEHPGVYAYEVDEPLGAWFYAYCVEHRDLPSDAAVLRKLGELSLQFHSPDISPEHQAELQRYMECRAGVAVQESVSEIVDGIVRENNSSSKDGDAIQLKVPQQMTSSDFAAAATVVKLENHGRKWEVFFAGRSLGFADEQTAELAALQAHKREVNNALYANDGDTPDWLSAELPSVEALAEYPELIRTFPVAAKAVLERCSAGS